LILVGRVGRRVVGKVGEAGDAGEEGGQVTGGLGEGERGDFRGECVDVGVRLAGHC